MSEWRDFLESVELTDRQRVILERVANIKQWRDNEGAADELEILLIEEFTGVRIV